MHNAKKKTLSSLVPAITSTIGKCLGIYSRSLSAQRTFYSLILSNGGITDACMNRLAKLADTVTHQSVLTKLNGMAKRYDAHLKNWPQFSIVVDNVDMLVRPRREDSSKSNKMYHMVQAIAVKDRVITQIDDNSRLPTVSVQNIKPADVYPQQEDVKQLTELMISTVVRVLGEMPALEHLKLDQIPNIHKFSSQTSRKSHSVSNQIVATACLLNMSTIVIPFNDWSIISF